MTKIEWTDESWGPIAAFDRETDKRGWFCTKVSPGCKNCFAERLNLWVGNGHAYTTGNMEKVELRLVNLDQPLRWKQPRRIFVCSMTDLFHEAVPIRFIRQVFELMARCPQHTFQVLTKRPGRMRALLSETPVLDADEPHEHSRLIRLQPLPNVWLGVSVENQETAEHRIPLLLQTPTVVRWISAEPLLGHLDLSGYLADHDWERGVPGGLRWVVCGCESAPQGRRRQTNLFWVRELKDQCVDAGTPFFLKQLYVMGKKTSRPELDGRTWEEYPEVKR